MWGFSERLIATWFYGGESEPWKCLYKALRLCGQHASEVAYYDSIRKSQLNSMDYWIPWALG